MKKDYSGMRFGRLVAKEPKGLIRDRLIRGWSIEEAITKPLQYNYK